MASICHNLKAWNTGIKKRQFKKQKTSHPTFIPSAHPTLRKLATAVSKLEDYAQSDSIDEVHIGNKF